MIYLLRVLRSTKSNYKLFILLLLCANTSYGQVVYDGSGGAFSSWFNPVASLMLSIGAVLAFLGAIKVYNNMQLGNRDTVEGATNLIGGALFLLISGGVVKLIFGM